ncbi:uncharacterized protein LOC102154504 isoform X1 [Canis lupus familiaris]|uniref:uncharacterized protein LOC102154504 isoform X1 n=1 Tax=Canis lupus familiaris TaxID=9615 RepID=UPI0018F7DF1D|nr:uncharacterized protein LOC102154504 isoform X1 [Canis lupus familiaris]
MSQRWMKGQRCLAPDNGAERGRKTSSFSGEGPQGSCKPSAPLAHTQRPKSGCAGGVNPCPGFRGPCAIAQTPTTESGGGISPGEDISLAADDVACHSSFKKAVTYRQCDAVLKAGPSRALHVLTFVVATTQNIRFGTNNCFSTWVSCIFLDSQEALTSGISLYCAGLRCRGCQLHLVWATVSWRENERHEARQLQKWCQCHLHPVPSVAARPPSSLRRGRPLPSGLSACPRMLSFCDSRILAWLGYALSSGCHEAAAKGLAGLPSHVVAWPGRDAPPGSSGCRHSGFPCRRGTAGLCRPGPGRQLLRTTVADCTNPTRRVSAASLPTSPSRVKPRAKQTSLHLGPAGGLRREDCGGRTAEGGLREPGLDEEQRLQHPPLPQGGAAWKLFMRFQKQQGQQVYGHSASFVNTAFE